MKTVTKFFTGAAAAAMITVGAAAPAEAQYRTERHDRYDRDDGIDVGDIIAGVAILGGIAAIAGAFDRDRGRYGHDNRYRYRDDYRAAVNSCGHQAQRYARGGNVRITDVDRVSGNRYRVRGEVQARGYDRYNRYDRYDRRDRYDRYNRADRFTCYAYSNGRIQDFNMRG